MVTSNHPNFMCPQSLLRVLQIIWGLPTIQNPSRTQCVILYYPTPALSHRILSQDCSPALRRYWRHREPNAQRKNLANLEVGLTKNWSFPFHQFNTIPSSRIWPERKDTFSPLVAILDVINWETKIWPRCIEEATRIVSPQSKNWGRQGGRMLDG